MARIDSLQTLLVAELRDLLDAERRLTKALPKMAKAASKEELRAAFNEHLEQTEEHVARLDEALSALDVEPKAKTCHGMAGLVEEGSEQMQEDYEDEALRDAAIIGAAQKVEHYEIASYGTAVTFARLLGNDHVAGLLERTLQEEKEADRKLTEIAEQMVNPEALHEEGEEDEDESMAGTRGSASDARTGRTGTASTSRGRNGRSASAGRGRR
jgi:ferritin-like metal-binding protein YciE